MGVYSVAKVITFIEICLTCNFLLVYELIGIYGKESVWLIIGIIFRSLEIVACCVLSILFFALADDAHLIIEKLFLIGEPKLSLSNMFMIIPLPPLN